MVGRRRLLAAGALALAAPSAVLSACSDDPSLRERAAADAALLAPLLAAERRAEATYAAGRDALSRTLAGQARAHVLGLEEELRRRGAPVPPRRPHARRPDRLAAAQAALTAYAGALPRLTDRGLRGVLAGNAATAAEQVAALRAALGRDPAPDAFVGP